MHVARVEWALLPADEARRLQALGVEPGVEVEVLHRGILLWKDPLAIRIGQMTVAMRRAHAAAILCAPIPDESAPCGDVTAPAAAGAESVAA